MPLMFAMTFLLAAGTTPLVSSSVVPSQSTAKSLTLHLTPLDGQILVQDALERNTKNGFSMQLVPNGGGFAVKDDRLFLNAVAAYQGISCTVHLEGAPMIINNNLSIRDPKITTEGPVCTLALALLQTQIKQSLDAHPWDLAKRLARSTVETDLAGPHLSPELGCTRESQITIQSANAKANELVVDIAVAGRAPGTSCP
jgi:hypothetical protein